MTNSGHIVIDPAILAGKPIIRGTRLSVEFIVQLLALQYAADVLGSEKIYPLADTSV
jgi:uncharacterized protein (DUF433 family)